MMRRWFLLVSCLISFAGISQEIDVLHYRYLIRLNDKNDSLEGIAEITFIQKSDNGKVSFDLAGVNQEGKGMIATVSMGTRRLKFSHDSDKLIISLPKSRRGDTTKVWINYRGIPSDGLIISKNKYGDKTFFADNWPNRAHFWIPCKDVPNDKASFEFSVEAPPQYKVISNGVKVKEITSEGTTMTHWKENTPLPTKVMVIGAANFATKTFDDSPPNLPVSAWVYRQDSTKGFHDYAPAPGIVKFFSNYIAPFPYEKLANVQSKTIFGGMENASAIFYFEGSVTGKGGVEDLLAHEIAHQWFGDMASEKSFTHLWLSEGFATYFTDIYWQHQFGEDAFRKRLQKEREEVVQFVKRNDHPVVDSLSAYMDLLNANSYQKGAWVLHMLRNEVGDTTFHKIIQTYYQRYKGGNADTRDFEAVAETVSGKNLKWFFDQWLYRPGIPQLEVTWKPDAKAVRVRQVQKQAFRFPLEISFVSQDGKKVVLKLSVSKADETFTINGNPTNNNVVLDPDTRLLFAGSLIKQEKPSFK